MRETVEFAYVPGDGAAPERMNPACQAAIKAARKYGDTDLVPVLAPMGWSAYDQSGDTLPPSSLEIAKRLGIVFFGGVGDDDHDAPARQFPEMRPERKVLLGLRQNLGLLMNHRPAIFLPELQYVAGAKANRIPAEGMILYVLRELLEDVYFGSTDLGHLIPPEVAAAIGFVQKKDVTGKENCVSMLGYYTRASLLLYFHHAFNLARERKFPVVNVDKSNIEPCSEFWRRICTEVHDAYYPDVPLRHLYIDAACAALFNPAELGNCVMTAGNVYGDILTDAANAAAGSLGMMCSSSVNPQSRAALFETGTGTAPKLKGKNEINPLGNFLTAAMMLRHLGKAPAGEAVEQAVRHTLQSGFRIKDLCRGGEARGLVLGTKEMAEQVIERI